MMDLNNFDAWDYKKTEAWIQQQDNMLGRIHSKRVIGALEATYCKRTIVSIAPWGNWEATFEADNVNNAGKFCNMTGLKHVATGMLAALLQGPDMLALEIYNIVDYTQECEAHLKLDAKDVKWSTEQ